MQDQPLSSILWRGKWIVLVATVIGVATGMLVAKATTRVYGASATIEVSGGSSSSPNASPNDLQLAAQGEAQTDATLIGAKGFLQVIRPHVLGGRLSTGDLESRTSATAVANTSLVEISATGPSPAEAQQLADDVANQFVAYERNAAQATSVAQQALLRQQLQGVSRRIAALPAGSAVQRSSLLSARASLEAQLSAVIASSVVQGGSVRVAAPATASSSPIRPRATLDALAGLLLGLLAGLVLAWARARLDRGVHSAREAEELLGAPVLASVPLRSGFSRDDAVLGEAYDVVRANLSFVAHDRPLQVLTVTSYKPREGKSSSVEGLAYAAARAGLAVAIVDADVRTRTLSTRLGTADEPGLTSVLAGAASLGDVLVEPEPGVALVPAGPTPPNPPSLLAGERMRSLLDDLRAHFSLILVDSPPVAHLADTTILASASDGVVVVARVGETRRADLTAAADNLRHSPTPIVGAVLLERVVVDETYYPPVSKGVRDAPGDRAQELPAETADTI